MSGFQRATQQQGRLRMALIGPSGSGKTYSALNIGQHLGDRVALVDTERGSASKYARKFNFDVLELQPPFDPRRYVEAINQAAEAGYPVLIVDSLSQAWAGQGGALDLVDKAAARTQSQNTFGAWREVTPLQNLLVDTMLGYPGHLIATIRAKMEHVQEKDERGKTVVRKVGLQPVQRDQIEYEFDIVADMDMDNRLLVSKSRCEELTSAVIEKPGKDVADVLRAWLSEGEPIALKPQAPATKPTAADMESYARGIKQVETINARATLRGDREPIDLSAFEASGDISRSDLIALSKRLKATIDRAETQEPEPVA